MRGRFADVRRSASDLMRGTNRVRRVHQMQCRANDVNGLLIAALMASVHPNRSWHRRGGYAVPACCLPCDAMSELLLMSDCSGYTEQKRPSVNAAGVCSYLSDRMSLSVRHYPLCACC